MKGDEQPGRSSASRYQVRRVCVAGLLTVLVWAAGCQRPGGGFALTPGADEETWAIRCITLQGPERFQRANAYAEALKKVPGLKPELVQVLSEEDGTTVFYGRYQREYGPDGATERYEPNHLHDLEVIHDLSARVIDADGRPRDSWPFRMASMDLLPTYRPAHPEWNLEPAEGYWSLHVAVFYNTETMRSRRFAAEEYCRLLREQGEPAYYHHGLMNSSVCVGTYPEGAVIEIRRDDPLAGTLVVTSKMVDPQMLEAQKRFPTSLQNGHTVFDIVRDPKTNEVRERVATPSFPVMMPRAQRQLERPGGS